VVTSFCVGRSLPADRGFLGEAAVGCLRCAAGAARAVLASSGTVYDVVGEIAAAMCFLAVSSGVASPGIDSGPVLRRLILAVPI